MADNPVPRVLGYCRASTRKQVDSPEVQRGKIQDYAAFHKLGVVTCFVDPAKSGKVPWEEREAGRATEFGIRVVRVRTGVVLSPRGGAFQKMLAPFKLGLGGPLGSGREHHRGGRDREIRPMVLAQGENVKSGLVRGLRLLEELPDPRPGVRAPACLRVGRDLAEIVYPYLECHHNHPPWRDINRSIHPRWRRLHTGLISRPAPQTEGLSAPGTAA